MRPGWFGLLATVLIAAGIGAAQAQSVTGHDNGPDAGELIVGTNYQPVDRTPDQIRRDVALIKQAGFPVVRMGDHSWDYFELKEGVFDLKPFDAVMDAMQANDIRVILDIPGLLAPQWLHHKYPGVDIVAADGGRRHAAERYMDDISDPDYRRVVLDFADRLTRHCARHPAEIALGYDNEIGNSYMSYSAATRERSIAWLKQKYGDLSGLNRAWATQRWSRRLSS